MNAQFQRIPGIERTTGKAYGYSWDLPIAWHRPTVAQVFYLQLQVTYDTPVLGLRTETHYCELRRQTLRQALNCCFALFPGAKKIKYKEISKEEFAINSTP
jgi:hypothetical protein